MKIMIIAKINSNNSNFSEHDDDAIHGRIPWMFHAYDAACAKQSDYNAATAIHE